MEAVNGTSLPVFIGLTCIVFGFCAYMTGQGLAMTWRPVWQVFPYAALLGLADRFFVWGLFEGDGGSVVGYMIDTGVILALILFAYRVTRVRQMVRQYPWLYETAGPFGWRARRGAGQ